MHFAPVSIEDKDLFDHYLAMRKQQLITYIFTSFFMWKDWEFFRWCLLDGALCIKSDFFGYDAVLPPLAADDQVVLQATESLIAWYRQRNVPFLLKDVSPEMLQLYQKAWPNRFEVKEIRPGANYIYKQEDLALLPGKKYHKKRNHLSAFLRTYPNHCFLPMTKELIPACEQYIHEWFAQHKISEDLIWEKHGLMQGLKYFERLSYVGCCLIVNDRIEGLTFGEPLNDEIFAVYAEKANQTINGIYAAINKHFSQEYAKGYAYINRAEDMGHPGLTKAKQSYHPHHLAMQYCLLLK
jgi:hypothetical protein